FLDRSGAAAFVFHTGDAMSIRIRTRAKEPTDDFVFGVALFSADGVCCYGTNTSLEEMKPEQMSGEGEITFGIDSLDLVEGTYKVDIAAHKRDGYPYDYHRLLYTFRVKSRTHDVGIYRPRHRWHFSPNIRFKP
ncbi:MAG TPA: Wzt carbohydrate-binding domain-containing protein, partial [Vicinamibacterales bacterium]